MGQQEKVAHFRKLVPSFLGLPEFTVVMGEVRGFPAKAQDHLEGKQDDWREII